MRKIFIILAAVYITSLAYPVFALPDSAPSPVPAPEPIALCLENITPGTPPMGDIGGCIQANHPDSNGDHGKRKHK